MKCKRCNGTGGEDPSLVNPGPCPDCSKTGPADSATCRFIGGPFDGETLRIDNKVREIVMFQQPQIDPTPVLGQLGMLGKLELRRHLYTRGRTGDYYWTGPA